jgi:hypothetical protein
MNVQVRRQYANTTGRRTITSPASGVGLAPTSGAAGPIARSARTARRLAGAIASVARATLLLPHKAPTSFGLDHLRAQRRSGYLLRTHRPRAGSPSASSPSSASVLLLAQGDLLVGQQEASARGKQHGRHHLFTPDPWRLHSHCVTTSEARGNRSPLPVKATPYLVSSARPLETLIPSRGEGSRADGG